MRKQPAPSLRLIAACGLIFAQAAAGSAALAAATLDRERPRWAALDLGASKLLMSASARVEARIRPAADFAGELRPTPVGRPVAAGPQVLEMVYAASGLGRESLTTLWADPATGATLQSMQRDAGSRERYRIYRFTDAGSYHYTRWPATHAEEGLPPAQWTRAEEGMREWPVGAHGQPVTEATALLWMAAAADLSQAGDRLETLTFSRRHVNRVTIEVTGRQATKVDFVEQAQAGSRRRRGSVEAIVLRMRSSPVEAGADAEEFELLGLRGDLELRLDPQTRAPIELRGRVKVAGALTIRLKRLILR
jgi:hypothetical protein